MENQLDSENYWNRSTSKAFSFDDDDGSSGISSGGSAVKWDIEIGVGGGGSSSILNDDAISEASFDNSAAAALNLSIKSVITEQALKTILMEQTLDDNNMMTKGMTPEEELKLLRRQIQTTLYNPSADTSAYKMLLGKQVTLEVFKSLEEKELLLDTVMSNGGGDAIIGVLLFLKKSLNREQFYKILQRRPKALEHYLSYVKQRHSNEAVELLIHFGKQQEAAVMLFQAALNCDDLQLRKQKLRQLFERYTNDGIAVISLYQQIFHASIKLLELVEKERNALDNLVNLNSTPIEVLHACCRKHNNWKEQDLVRNISPFRLCAEQQISAAQFEWTALNERAAAQAYADLENVFERVPTWSPIKQKQFHISFPLEVAILRLNELQAPNTVLYLFLSKMNNASDKLELAQRVKCTKALIDALASLKDVNQLSKLKETLPERSEEQYHCEKALKGLQSKRWSTDNIKLKL